MVSQRLPKAPPTMESTRGPTAVRLPSSMPLAEQAWTATLEGLPAARPKARRRPGSRSAINSIMALLR